MAIGCLSMIRYKDSLHDAKVLEILTFGPIFIEAFCIKENFKVKQGYRSVNNISQYGKKTKNCREKRKSNLAN